MRAAALSLGTILVLWELAARGGLYDVSLLPSPSRVAEALVDLATRGVLWTDMMATVTRVITGFVSGTTLGFLMGLLTGRSRRIQPFVEPVIQIARPVPAVALVPLAIVWFGIGELQKYFIVSWASFFPVWVNTHLGVRRVPREFLWTARVLGASKAQTVLGVVIPWSLAFVQAGTRVALGLAFTATVVAEMSGASEGLGFRIMSSHLVFRVDQMIGVILIIGLIGAVFDQLFQVAIRKLLPWI